MDLSTMLSRFNTQRLTHIELTIPNMALKQSAVLVPLIIKDGELSLILTKRCEHLRHHPGQISFPGGKFDEADQFLVNTALRETREELGIESKYIDVIGDFPKHHTATGFSIKPYVALIDSDASFIINKEEVNKLLIIPLSLLISPTPHHFDVHIQRNNIAMQVYFKPVNGELIWGATATIIEQLRLLVMN